MKVIHKLAIAGAAVVTAAALASPTFAADLAARPYVKAPPPVPVFSWTGFYIGGHVGAGWGTTTTDANIGSLINGFFPTAGVGFVLPIGQTQMNGFLGGAQVGYNWQTGGWVLGIEGDITWTNLKGNTACLVLFNCESKVGWMADITGRVGATFLDRGLIYVKGGAAWADSKYSFGQNLGVGIIGAAGMVNGSVSDTRLGGTLGAGVEYAFAPNWSAKVEYDYFDFGKANYNLPITASGAIAGVGGGSVTINTPISVREQIHTIKVGASYHFQ